jgi:hypothetical protein
MARKKPTPKPLFAVKHDFVDSLENVAQQIVFLVPILRSALDRKLVNEVIEPMLRERLEALEAALFTKDEPEAP